MAGTHVAAEGEDIDMRARPRGVSKVLSKCLVHFLINLKLSIYTCLMFIQVSKKSTDKLSANFLSIHKGWLRKLVHPEECYRSEIKS